MPGSSSKTVASALIGGASISGALLAYAALIEPYAIQHVEVTLWSERLPTSFDGYTVLLLSDFHSQGIERRERLVLDMIGALPTPDLIALDGDFIYTPRGMEAFASEFGGALRARDGVFAVFGNSEHKNGVVPHQFAGHLEANGVTVLLNRNTRVQRGGETIAIAGVDDPASFHDDVASAVDGIPGTEFQIMLMHSPDSIGVACSLGVDLVLSGHTHGGQIKLPIVGAPYTHSRLGRGMSHGLYTGKKLGRVIGGDPGRTQLYVTRGIGISGLALRFLCRPEITTITLRRTV